jgi:putative heme-binding domain-containing protein
MPVAQKTGPDGCLYILDWYDRYHCYQDANRDPGGIDRLRGRLYRVRYKESSRAARIDLAKETDDKLIERLGSPNVYFRDTAQRLLAERNTRTIHAKLEKLVLDERAPRKARMHGLWGLLGGAALEPGFHAKLLAHADAGFRAWGVRAAGNQGKVDAALRERVAALANDPSADVLLQVAIAARKVEGIDPIPTLVEVLAHCGSDKLIPHIVWQNLHPLLEDRANDLLAVLRKRQPTPNLGLILPRAAERLLGARKPAPAVLADLFELTTGKQGDTGAARSVLEMLAAKTQSGEIQGAALAGLQKQFAPRLRGLLEGNGPLRADAALLAATFRDPAGLAAARELFASPGQGDGVRVRALEALIAVRDSSVLSAAGKLLETRAGAVSFRARVLAALGRLEDDKVAAVVLAAYPRLDGDLPPRAVELLTQRPAWGKELVKAVAAKKVPVEALNVNQLRRLLASKDAELVKQVKAHWGTVREGRNPEREKVVAEMKRFLQRARGDEKRGMLVYRNLCGQCHKIHGEGTEVGPDITSNGRASFDQLLSNVFDPSLVIGAAYQATTVETKRGRYVTGLLVEDSPARVVLKLQGGKQEVVPRSQVESVSVSPSSLMPEGIEKQLKPQEIADLFAFLTLDKHPDDPKARRIPGAPRFR